MSRPSQYRDGGGAPRATTEDEARVGTVVGGRYRLDKLIGRGGMGLVYKAEHIGIHRTLALKLLHSSLAQVPELRSRFEREARAIGVISHPNCVDVTDFGELDDGSLYLAMEYIEGVSLGDVLDRERAVDPKRALRILRHVLMGLGHAHHAGIVHRDVKPENVLLCEQNGDPEFAKILDFGIAKLTATRVDDGVKLTQAGVAFGTPVYMSPEQALGNPVDQRADLYAASVMAYEMICGKPPFFSEDKLEVLSMHTARPVPPMDEMRRSVLGPRTPPLPPGVEALIMKGLAKPPTERWPDADTYIAAVDEVLITLALDDDPTTMSRAAPPDRNLGSRPLLSQTGRSLIESGERPINTPSGLRALSSDGNLTPTSQKSLPAASTPHSEPVLLVPRPAPGGGTRAPTTFPDRVLGLVKRQPVIAMAAGAGVVVLIAVVLLLALRDDGGPSRPSQSELAREAAAKLDRGDPSAAIRTLEARPEELATDATAQVTLGHAYAARREQARALLAYRKAMELDPRVESDPALRANLAAISGDTDLAAAMAAYELRITMTKDPDATPGLIGDASGDDPDRRRAAIALVERMGLGTQVDWLAAYTKDLDQGATCEKRKEAVAKLRALGDPRAIAALEEAIERKGKNGKYKGKPINRCLGEDARAAIDFLKSLGGDAGATPTNP